MVKKRLFSKITAVACAAVLSVVSFQAGQAAGTQATGSQTTYNSQGIIKYGSGADAVVFDARDFATIDNAVSDGKKKITTALNNYVASMRGDGTNTGRGTYVGGASGGNDRNDTDVTKMSFDNIKSTIDSLAVNTEYDITADKITQGSGSTEGYSEFLIPPGFYDGTDKIKVKNDVITGLIPLFFCAFFG